ncbi:hypothetical protein ACVWZD_005815 [Streptomyces sp. TE3672]
MDYPTEVRHRDISPSTVGLFHTAVVLTAWQVGERYRWREASLGWRWWRVGCQVLLEQGVAELVERSVPAQDATPMGVLQEGVQGPWQSSGQRAPAAREDRPAAPGGQRERGHERAAKPGGPAIRAPPVASPSTARPPPSPASVPAPASPQFPWPSPAPDPASPPACPGSAGSPAREPSPADLPARTALSFPATARKRALIPLPSPPRSGRWSRQRTRPGPRRVPPAQSPAGPARSLQPPAPQPPGPPPPADPRHAREQPIPAPPATPESTPPHTPHRTSGTERRDSPSLRPKQCLTSGNQTITFG